MSIRTKFMLITLELLAYLMTLISAGWSPLP